MHFSKTQFFENLSSTYRALRARLQHQRRRPSRKRLGKSKGSWPWKPRAGSPALARRSPLKILHRAYKPLCLLSDNNRKGWNTCSKRRNELKSCGCFDTVQRRFRRWRRRRWKPRWSLWRDMSSAPWHQKNFVDQIFFKTFMTEKRRNVSKLSCSGTSFTETGR